MTSRVLFLPAARQDVMLAQDWYEAASPGLGARFLTELDRVVAVIAANPEQFACQHRDVRRARLRQFPYALFYEVRGASIVVIACFHASRDPAVWRSRHRA